jgi:hypothetical protein
VSLSLAAIDRVHDNSPVRIKDDYTMWRRFPAHDTSRAFAVTVSLVWPKKKKEPGNPLECPAPARDQVDDENHQCDHEQQVNQGARNVQAESQKPKNHQDYKNRPKHRHLFTRILSAPEI